MTVIIVWGVAFCIAAAVAMSAYLVKTTQLPDIEDMEPRDPRLGRF